VSGVQERLLEVKARIAAAALGAGRDSSEVSLVAVSKTVAVAAIEEAYQAGQREFGENYVQELVVKAEALAHLPDIRWHFLGHLQTNKAKLVAGVGATLHSLDSERLIKALGKRRAALGTAPLSVLLEVNLAGEAQKGGCAPEAAAALASAVEAENALILRGLMAIPPQGDGASSAGYFEELKRLRDQLGGQQRLPELSMGMSADYPEAIAAGATMVRVGSAIFGPRAARTSA
jgi:pyridoxal phosphate enzyme (YggS family)